jgi:hypothetical protein
MLYIHYFCYYDDATIQDADDDDADAQYDEAYDVSYNDDNPTVETEAVELAAAVHRIVQQCVDVLLQNGRVTSSEAQCLLQPSAKVIIKHSQTVHYCIVLYIVDTRCSLRGRFRCVEQVLSVRVQFAAKLI